MSWFHTSCAGISDLDEVGAWVCANCRFMPEMIIEIESKLATVFELTPTMMKNWII